MSTAEQLLTAEEYFRLSDKPEYSELVRGVIFPMTPPGFRHGLICARVSYLIQSHLEVNDVGRVLSNDTGIITQRDPDTVRGGDVTFYSYERLPREVVPAGYPAASPNIVFEVRSPNDRWSEIHEKIGEYLTSGVELVCVLVPETRAAHLFYPDRPGAILHGDEELTLPAPMDDFRHPVSAVFPAA